jgi:hypothetical protein
MWSRAIEGFDRSREDHVVQKECVVRPTTSGEPRTPNSGETSLPQGPPPVTFSEITIRQQNGDPRFLSIALRLAEREDRKWQHPNPPPMEVAESARYAASVTSHNGGELVPRSREPSMSHPE